MHFGWLVPAVARLMEAGGILAMALGPFVAAAAAFRVRLRGGNTVYRVFRQQLGRAILLGLEFLVAADILRTVSEVPSFEHVVVLAVIVLIRTLLSFTLEVELEGAWPWKRGSAASAGEGG
jgi:uncharacterized membrane protein